MTLDVAGTRRESSTVEGGNAARELADALRTAAQAADADDADVQEHPAGMVTFDEAEGSAVLRAADGATAWVVPTGTTTYLELVDRDGGSVWCGEVLTAGLLAHLLEWGVSRAGVAAFVAGPATDL